MAWLSPILWPFLRVLALFSVAPVFSMRVVPMRVKIGLAFLVALCAQGVLGEQPVISVNGREALGTVVEILTTGANDVYVVQGERGEVLLPARSEVVRSIDLSTATMTVELLPGL